MIAPAGVEFVNGTVRLTKAYGSNYLFAGYRWQAPMTGFYLDPPGLDGLDTYGAQSGANLAGWHHAGHRVYDPGVQGRWTTPDPAESPWTNLMDYVSSNPTKGSDPSGLAMYKLSYLEWAKTQGRCGGSRWKIEWRLKGIYSHSRKKGDHWLVQRITALSDRYTCAGNQITEPDTYLEAWRIRFNGVGVGYKARIAENDNERDNWWNDPFPGTYGFLQKKGQAIWVKNSGPNYWPRSNEEDAASGLRWRRPYTQAQWSKYPGLKSDKRSSSIHRERTVSWDCCP